jgi:putative flippase GtrA
MDALLMSLSIADVSRLPALLNTGAARPIRFGAVGLVTFVVQLGSFFLLKQMFLPSVVAYAIGLARSRRC